MSRIGRKPINIPAGVEIKQNGNVFTVKGPKGELTRELSSEIKVNIDGNEITFERPNDLPNIRALHGTTRANLNNMVVGVSDGFTINLELVGVGYRVQANGKGLTLALGYSHPIEVETVEGINFKVELANNNNNFQVSTDGSNYFYANYMIGASNCLENIFFTSFLF